MKIHILIRISLYLAFTSFLWAVEPRSHWEDTLLTPEVLPDLIHDDVCLKNESLFTACFQALSAAVAERGLSFFPLESLNEDFGFPLSKVGPVALVNVQPAKALPPAQAQARYLQRAAYFKKAYAELYRKKETMGFSFQTLLTMVTQQNQFTARPREFTAKTMNAFLNAALDAHSRLVPYAAVAPMIEGKENKILGFGFRLIPQVSGSTFIPTVDFVVTNGPAFQGGLRRGDILVSINGRPFAGKSQSEVDAALAGDEGETVELTVIRRGRNKVLTMTRSEIPPSTFEIQLVQHGPKKYGVLRFDHFMANNICKRVAAVLPKFEAHQAAGLIIDLRGNRGGQLENTQCLGSLFLKDGTPIVYERKFDNQVGSETFKSTNPEPSKLPLAVIIDELTASAGEILASALQDTRRAFLVGNRTYGKGSIQSIDILNETGVLSVLTSALYFRPSGFPMQGQGTIPNFYAFRKPKPSEDEKISDREENKIFTIPYRYQPWKETDPNAINSISKCVAARGMSLERFNGPEGPATDDYPLLVSQDILTCAAELGLSRTSGDEIKDDFSNIDPGVKRDSQTMEVVKTLTTKLKTLKP